jgi:hypothetical protein
MKRIIKISFVFCVSLFFLICPGSAEANDSPKITMISPSAGAIVNVGSTQVIQWQQTGFTANDNLRISLIEVNENGQEKSTSYLSLKPIDPSKSQDSFDWNVSGLGGKYKIKISVSVRNDANTFDKISDDSGIINVNYNVELKLTGVNSESKFSAGSEMEVGCSINQALPEERSLSCSFELLKGGASVERFSTFSNKTDLTKTYKTILPSDLIAGNDYQVKLVEYNSGKEIVSDYFTILSNKTIDTDTLTKPSAGEVIQSGAVYNLPFNSIPIQGGRVFSFYLVNGAGKETVIYGTMKDSSYEVSMPLVIPSGSDYKLKVVISLSGGAEFKDYYSPAFTIKSDYDDNNANIKITFPTNDSILKIGNSYDIKWIWPSNQKWTSIDMFLESTEKYKGDALMYPLTGTIPGAYLATPVMNTGSYKWTIPSEYQLFNIMKGEIYKITRNSEGIGVETSAPGYSETGGETTLYYPPMRLNPGKYRIMAILSHGNDGSVTFTSEYFEISDNQESILNNPTNTADITTDQLLPAQNNISDGTNSTINNTQMFTRLRGKIILKVEDAGKAYYVNPKSETMHYLGRPDDAFGVMREQGVGITDINLEKVPIGLSGLSGEDTDGDGLSDMLEDAIGTDKNNKDTDGDGYDDKSEVSTGYSPVLKLKKYNHDNGFSDKQKGKIFLQVEGKGEAWYINPEDGKRYFLGRPADAFNVMRNLGLGISNSDYDSMSD